MYKWKYIFITIDVIVKYWNQLFIIVYNNLKNIVRVNVCVNYMHVCVYVFISFHCLNMKLCEKLKKNWSHLLCCHKLCDVVVTWIKNVKIIKDFRCNCFVSPTAIYLCLFQFAVVSVTQNLFKLPWNKQIVQNKQLPYQYPSCDLIFKNTLKLSFYLRLLKNCVLIFV